MTVCLEVAADAVYCRQTENIHLIPTGIPSFLRPFPRKGPIFPETVQIYVYFCCCLLIGTICCTLGSQFSDIFFLRLFNSPTDEKKTLVIVLTFLNGEMLYIFQLYYFSVVKLCKACIGQGHLQYLYFTWYLLYNIGLVTIYN